jgi:hypothetical protein
MARNAAARSVPLLCPLDSHFPAEFLNRKSKSMPQSVVVRCWLGLPPAFTLLRTYVSLMRRVAARQGLEPNSRNSGNSSKATATSCRRVALAPPRVAAGEDRDREGGGGFVDQVDRDRRRLGGVRGGLSEPKRATETSRPRGSWQAL